MTYTEFIESKSQIGGMSGFKPLWIPDFLFDFQKSLVEWAIMKGRAALLEAPGLGKTPQQLVWAQNVVQHTNKPVLILTPLGVSAQTLKEAQKFGIEATRSKDGQIKSKIVITNYESVPKFNRHDFTGVIPDEASRLKNFDGQQKAMVTEFMREIPYRLEATATPAPNDYIELGTLSEALGELGYMDMLAMFFKNDQGTVESGGGGKSRFDGPLTQNKWRFKRHAERPFWRWVASWARAVRKPSDVDPSFNDERFKLPTLIERETIIKASAPRPGMLFSMPAHGLKEQREEARASIEARCETAAKKANEHKGASILWCHLNDEGGMLEKITTSSRQVSGSQSDDEKEEIFEDFVNGKFDNLIVKPRIASYGLNWQHCHHQTWFPSHSFEEYFQGLRRSLRFGQTKEVTADIIASEGQSGVLRNLQRKSIAAERMFTMLLESMWQEIKVKTNHEDFTKTTEVPQWLSKTKAPV